MSKYYNKEYLCSTRFSDMNNLLELYSNYHKYPIPAIRFAHLVYQRRVEKTIVNIIRDKVDKCENIIDCLIHSSTLKLCTSETFKSLICTNECICTKKVKFNKLFDDLTDIIVEDPSILNSIQFATNYSTLIKKTGVYDEKLYEILNNMTDDSNEFLPIINLIIRAELFSKKYYNILEKIMNISEDREILATCSKIRNLITLHNSKCSHIKDNLYISDINYAINNVTITDNNFDYVISVTTNDIICSEGGGIKYIKIGIPDNSSVDFIDNTKETLQVMIKVDDDKKILCHCYSGISRSVLFTALLIKDRYNMTFKKSLSLVKKSRSIAYPNREIIKQIRKKLKQIDSDKIIIDKIKTDKIITAK